MKPAIILALLAFISLPIAANGESSGTASKGLEQKNQAPEKIQADPQNSDPITKNYVTNCLKKIERIANLRSPTMAEHPVSGKLLVSFELLPTGEVISVRLMASSGHPKPDDAAVRSIRMSSPCPPVPESLREKRGITSIGAKFSYQENTVSVEPHTFDAPKAVPARGTSMK